MFISFVTVAKMCVPFGHCTTSQNLNSGGTPLFLISCSTSSFIQYVILKITSDILQRHNVIERNVMPSNVGTVNYLRLVVQKVYHSFKHHCFPQNICQCSSKFTVAPQGALGHCLRTRALLYSWFLALPQFCFLLSSCLLFHSSPFYLFLGSSSLVSFPFAHSHLLSSSSSLFSCFWTFADAQRSRLHAAGSDVI